MDRIEIAKLVGQKLREWREDCELSLEEAARELEMSVHVLAGIESGVIRAPSDLLKSFAHLYKVAEEEFAGFIQSLVSRETGG